MAENNDSTQKQDSDEDEAPRDIRSRIAAFEYGASSAAPASPTSKSIAAAHPTSASTGAPSRTTITHGKYDPLQAMSSPPKTSEPTIIKLAERPRATSASYNSIKPAATASRGTSSSTRVALPGLGGRNTSSSSTTSGSSSLAHTGSTQSSSLSQSRPWPPVKEPTSPTDTAASAINTAMNETPSATSTTPAKSDLSTPKTGPIAISPRPTSSSSSSTLPVPPPQLPSRKNSNASTTTSTSTSFSSFTNVGSVTSEPPSFTSRIPPSVPGNKPTAPSSSSNSVQPVSQTSSNNVTAPRLPPRKQGSASSSLSTSSALDVHPRPPQRTSTLSATNSPSSTPAQSRSSSISQYTGQSNRPSRSSTVQSDTSGQTNPPSLSSLPPRPREQSTSLTSSVTRNMPPPPPHRSGSHGSTTSAPPLAARPNGSQSTPKTEGTPKRYEALWDKLSEVFGQPHQISTSGSSRLDGIVVRQVWKASKLSDATLSRIWNQCDTNRQGSLDKAGFAKGLALIDAELNQRRRRRGRP